MGKDLYAADQVFRSTMDRCSARIAGTIGTSLTDLLFRPRAQRFEPFDRAVYTYPALFSIQYSMAESLRSRGYRPDVILGYSLGEWIAQAVAGRVSPDQMLDLLVAQAKRVEAVCPRGGMLAVLQPPEIVEKRLEWFRDTWVSARNFERHFVVSGLTDSIAAVERQLRGEDIAFQRLPVLYPFHTPLMDSLEEYCAGPLRSLPFAASATRLFSARGEEVTDAQPAEALWRALRETVSFPEVVRSLERQGAPIYIDCGPSGTLATFVKYNLPPDQRSRCVAIMTPFDGNVERLNALGGALALAGELG
jgi:acyl transferase domain-containing protein